MLGNPQVKSYGLNFIDTFDEYRITKNYHIYLIRILRSVNDGGKKSGIQSEVMVWE